MIARGQPLINARGPMSVVVNRRHRSVLSVQEGLT
jgi:hypothetical protein